MSTRATITIGCCCGFLIVECDACWLGALAWPGAGAHHCSCCGQRGAVGGRKGALAEVRGVDPGWAPLRG